MLGRSSGNHDWLLEETQALAFLAVFVYATQATQLRKRLRLNGNRASHTSAEACLHAGPMRIPRGEGCVV